MGRTVKRFIKFLHEMPLPVGVDPNHLDPQSGKYTSSKTIKKLEQMGVKLGKGSSRIAFKLDVEASQFDPAILKKYNLPLEGMVETVIKLAINPKGLAQNISEIDHHETSQGSKFLLPILDDSVTNKGLWVGDDNLANWIQMPVAPPPTRAEFNKNFREMFGTNTINILRFASDMYALRKIEPDGVKVTEEQHENLNELVDLIEELGLGVGDLLRPVNWGMWKNHMFIIDYGYDDSTKNLYNGSQRADAYVDKDGKITLRTNKVQPRNSWGY